MKPSTACYSAAIGACVAGGRGAAARAWLGRVAAGGIGCVASSIGALTSPPRWCSAPCLRLQLADAAPRPPCVPAGGRFEAAITILQDMQAANRRKFASSGGPAPGYMATILDKCGRWGRAPSLASGVLGLGTARAALACKLRALPESSASLRPANDAGSRPAWHTAGGLMLGSSFRTC
jgi:hypothetical protein